MEDLIKQISMRFFRVEDENKAQTSRIIRDRKIPSRRTRSSKGDDQKSLNKGGRQNGKMETDEFRTAIAAATFVINCRRNKEQKVKEDTNSNIRKSSSDGHKGSNKGGRHYDPMETDEFRTSIAAAAFAVNSIKIKEQKVKQDLNSKNEKYSSEITEVSPKPTVTNKDLPSSFNQPKPAVTNSEIVEKVSAKTISPTPPVEKTPNLVSNKHSDEKSNEKEPESRFVEPNSWEKTEMEKIKQRFMKVKTTIFEWENKKKSKAKNKLTRKEGKLEWKRARALQDFKQKMETIEKISNGARSKNEERRKSEEIRVKEKAKMIKSTKNIQKPMFLCC